MLRDGDNDAGFYAAACGNADWTGAVLFRSSDGGASYASVMDLTTAATIGVVGVALGGFSGGNVPDELNTVNVTLYHGTLSSSTFAAFLNCESAALIGDEIIIFRTATLNIDGSYTLSGLLRGRRGTECAMSGHANGERFVLLDSSIRRIAAETSDIGIERLYKSVTSGMTLATATAQSFTNTGAALKPYAVVQIGGGRNADGSVVVNWIRRGRLSGEWRDSVDVPLGEDAESYDVEICDSSFATVKRTYSSLSSPTVTYAAADQTTDWGGLQSTIYVRVFQRSAAVGRGTPAQTAI
jgi:hypothetical protein